MPGVKHEHCATVTAFLEPMRRIRRVAVSNELLVTHDFVTQTFCHDLPVFFIQFCCFLHIDHVPLRRLNLVRVIHPGNGNDTAVRIFILLISGVEMNKTIKPSLGENLLLIGNHGRLCQALTCLTYHQTTYARILISTIMELFKQCSGFASICRTHKQTFSTSRTPGLTSCAKWLICAPFF